jgi:hypothetical protein
MDELETRRRRLRRARFWIQLEFAVAFALPLVAGFLYIAAPNGPTPMFYRESLVEVVLPWLGGLGVIVGIVWMVRIARADPEAGDNPWALPRLLNRGHQLLRR